MPNFVAYASASVERLWHQTENRLHDALTAVDEGKLFESDAHVATIKDAIALHLARSIATRIVHYRLWIKLAATSRMRWLTEWRPLLEDAFYKKKGIYAAGNQTLLPFP